jgi:hypothetical protein
MDTAAMPNSVRVSLEIGKARTFASALDWPGWSRAGKSEASFLEDKIDHDWQNRKAYAEDGTAIDWSVFVTGLRRRTTARTSSLLAPMLSLSCQSYVHGVREFRRVQSNVNQNLLD